MSHQSNKEQKARTKQRTENRAKEGVVLLLLVVLLFAADHAYKSFVRAIEKKNVRFILLICHKTE